MKKKAIVFFADMRTTFDTSFYDGRKVNVTEKFIDFTEKISEIARRENVNMAFLSTVSNHKRNESTLDINYEDFMMQSWYYACYIDGIFKSETSEIIEYINAKMGKNLYKDGYSVLNKKDGFGHYKMDEYSDDTEITQKAINYIKELEEEYDVEKVFIIDDQINTTFHKDAALDDEAIKKELGKQIIKIRPRLPYHSGLSSSISINPNGDGTVFSGHHTIDGVNECLDLYIDALKEKQVSNTEGIGTKVLKKKY